MTEHDNVMNPAEVGEHSKKGSIVPAKYAGKYKKGGGDELASFIETQCVTGEGTFSFDKFFDLCSANQIPAEKVEHYREQVNNKLLGAHGRARMTLRNMLATLVRKNKKLVGLDGAEHDIEIAPLPTRVHSTEAQA